MSGGHFDYVDVRLSSIKLQIEHDLKDGKVPDEVRILVEALTLKVETLREVLHEYDYTMSGDSNWDEFRKVFERAFPIPKIRKVE